MKRKFKIGFILNFDFARQDLTIIYNWFQVGMSENIERNEKSWYFVLLFIGIIVRYER